LITYLFPHFRLDFDPDAGSVYTCFHDGTASGCATVAGDHFHGKRLEISPQYHRLAHELAHHLIGIYVKRRPCSYVVSVDARMVAATGKGLDLATAEKHVVDLSRSEETLATALTYYALDKYDILEGDDQPYNQDPLLEIACQTNLDHLAGILQWLLSAPEGGVLDLTKAIW
jgi:hypothetical protein